MANQNLDIETLRAQFAYDPDTGIVTRLVNAGHAPAGAEAGCVDGQGYRQVQVKGELIRAHCIAWALTYGSWPSAQIDHIDGAKDNNRISNLRDVSQSTNQQNRKRSQTNNRSGSSVPGVSWDTRDKKFRATAKHGGKRVSLGYFATIADAEAASLAYRREQYEGFTL